MLDSVSAFIRALFKWGSENGTILFSFVFPRHVELLGYWFPSYLKPACHCFTPSKTMISLLKCLPYIFAACQSHNMFLQENKQP